MGLTKEEIIKLKNEFPRDVIKVKPGSKSKEKPWIQLILYVQHNDVADRIEEVDQNWTFRKLQEEKLQFVKYNGEAEDVYYVHGELTICGVTRQNVGEGSEPKGAYSDCLKRCAMLFGIGRYLYDEERVWAPYDETKDRFKKWTVDEYFELKERFQKKPAITTEKHLAEASGWTSSSMEPAMLPMPIPQNLGD